MSTKNDYELSMSLIKEAENLIKESQILLNDLSIIKGNRDYDNEIRALREKLLRIERQNNCLYIENIYLKSKIREMSMIIEKPNSYRPLLLAYKDKIK